MSKFTVAFAAAAKPVRLAAERVARAYCFGWKAKPEDLAAMSAEWEGWKISASLARRRSVVCHVPAPYHAMEIWYRAEHPAYGKFEEKPASELARKLELVLRKAAAKAEEMKDAA